MYRFRVLSHSPGIISIHCLIGRLRKSDMRLVDYYNDMNDAQKEEFRKQSFIPEGVSLELENFDEFYEKRKKILTVKIRELLG